MTSPEIAGVESPCFALDIGTRKVAGLVAEIHGRSLRVVAACMREHTDRAMVDGQVHNIAAVARIVGEVKDELQKAVGRPLTRVAVAAAGRTLLTESATVRRRYPMKTEVTRDDVLALELSGARSAQIALKQRHAEAEMHCVGFSTVRFTLDGQPVDEPVGHAGRELKAEVLATFLPRQVVESLLAVLRRVGLLATRLTLEPIAALEATLPPDLRRINLALVDVGAGTSDLALTRDGSVFAYDMVTLAGDEITDALCEHYLVEFPEGERMKKAAAAGGNETLSFTTLLGQTREASISDLLEIVRPRVQELAEAIAGRILSLNRVAPKAVVMVGGGSATPELGERLAAALGMDAHRVGVRGPEFIPDIENPTPALRGIDGVTPLGIALSVLRGRGLAFFSVHVNEAPVQVLVLHDSPTVFEALLAGGGDVGRLVPRPGRAVTYTVNGKLHTLPGSLGQAGTLSLNGAPAHLDTALAAGDHIEVVPAGHGADAILTGAQIPRLDKPAWCVINGHSVDLDLVLLHEGRPVAPETVLPDRAQLEWASAKPLSELLELAPGSQEASLAVRVNGEWKRLAAPAHNLLANGRQVTGDYRARPDDRIQAELSHPALRLREVVGDLPAPATLTVQVNGQPRSLAYGGWRVLVNGQPGSADALIPDQAEIATEKCADAPPTLAQVLEGLDLKPSEPGGTLKLFMDGQEAGYTTPLREGAKVDISFS